MTSKNIDELNREIRERNINALKLFEDAKKIQQGVSKLPFADRQTAMNEVVALETAALTELQKIIILEAEQTANRRKEARWQNTAYLSGKIFQIEN